MPVTLTPVSGSSDLVTLARATQVAALSALNSSNPAYLASLITAASRDIEGHCHRTFGADDYTQYYSGSGYPYDLLRLEQYPVISISRVATTPAVVLTVRNTDSATNQRATVATTDTGLNLVRVASAVSTPSGLTYASYPTLTALAAAINALGNGWSATVDPAYALYPSADLRPMQGATTATGNGVGLELYTEEVPTWGGSFAVYDANFGWQGGTGPGWRLDAEAGELVGLFPAGRQNVRVDYRGGYEDVPADVQEACVQHVLDLYHATTVNNNLQSSTLGPYSYTLNTQTRKALSPKVAGMLSKYVAYSNVIGRRGGA